MSKRLYLLDAYALIYRSYYAFIKKSQSYFYWNKYICNLWFYNDSNRFIRKRKTTHIAVVFDPPYPTFRHELFKDYKANREATPEDIKKSIPFIKEIINALNISGNRD
jgi:DNA polymerase-1